MRKIICFFFTFYFFIQYLFGQLYITNTNVLDVEKMQLRRGQTIEIVDGKISTISNGKKKTFAAGSKRIDGTGKYLIPGLVDAHVHFFQSGGLYTRPDVIDLRKYKPYSDEVAWAHQQMEDQLRRYSVCGITTVIDVGATINFLKQKDSLGSKKDLPAIFMTGPLLTTYLPDAYKDLGDDSPFFLMKTEEDAREYVRKELPFKPDLIKIWYIVSNNTENDARKSLPLVRAVIDEAHKHQLRVAVHATERVTAQLAVESGCDFLVHSVDDEILQPGFIDLLKKQNVVLCPTLIVLDNYYDVFGQKKIFTLYEHKYANPTTLGSLMDVKHLSDTALINFYKNLSVNRAGRNAKSDSIMKINLKNLVDGGVTIASGTDAGNIGTLHAVSYYDELLKMKAAGMSLWQILQASTINGAKAVGREKEFGSITPGKLANLVLLDSNPLDNIENWKSINKVIITGDVVDPDSVVLNSPAMVVQQQVNGYNAHNLAAFLAPYSDDIKIYKFPDTLLISGKKDMRAKYQKVENDGLLHCEIKNRIINGNKITDDEHVTSKYGIKDARIMYIIESGKIKSAYFL